MEMFNISIRPICIRFLMTILFLILPLTAVYAIDINLNTMLAALKSNAEPIIALTKTIAYVMGFWLAISGIQDLKVIGHSRGFGMSPESGQLSRPLMRFGIGVALIYFPSTIDLAVSTLWGSSSILEYQVTSSDPFGPAKEGAVALIKIIGYISFVRGLIILSRSTSHQGSQQGTIGKGIVHLIGGILAINIGATIEVIKNSLGFVS